MKQQIERSLETSSKEHFQHLIDTITSRPLTPEIIDSYAEDALEDLVTVVHDITTSYEKQPVVYGENHRAQEQAASVYYGLDPTTIEETLDHIADKAEEIRELDGVIEAITTRSGNVLVPPDSKRLNIEPGDGSFGEKQTIPRLKTLLFVLSNEFGIDLRNPGELKVTNGVLKDTMMRLESYNLVEIPTIDRTVLVCDEEGNATYVFDNEALEKSGMEASDLTKDDLNDLLKDEPLLGQRIIYTGRFVQNIVAALKYTPQEAKEAAEQETGQYLQRVEPVPHDYFSRSHLAKQFSLDVETVTRAIKELDAELGDVRKFKFKYGAPTYAYSPVQQDLICQKLEADGAFVRVGDEYKPLAAISIELFGTLQRRGSVRAAINALEVELGDVVMAKGGSGKKPTARYSSVQQEVIRNYLQENGYMTPRPEGYTTINGIARALSDTHGFGVSDGLVSTAIEELGERVLGKPLKAIGGRYPTDFYSPEQQELIGQHLQERGNFMTPPEGYLSSQQIAAKIGVATGSIEGAIEGVGEEELGLAVLARTTASAAKKPYKHYSPEQQDKIVEWLRQNGRRGTKEKLAHSVLNALRDDDYQS